jgi:hypothetical protein
MARRRHTAAPAGGIPLGGNAIKVNLRRTPHESDEADEPASSPRRLHLVLKNFRARVQPGILYHVFLSLPPGVAGRAAERHYVGRLNFFNAVPHAGHRGEFVGKTRSFDITDLSSRLREAGLLHGTPNVTIAPAGEPAAAAQPLIGEISLVEE